MSEFDEFVEPPSSPQPVEETTPEPPVEGKLAGPFGPKTAADPLPPDIEEIWGQGRLDGMGQPAERSARTLIASWGLEGFRKSAIHQAALKDARREAEMTPIRAAFIKAKAEKTGKKERK